MILDQAALHALIDHAFDHLCEQPLSAFVDSAQILPSLDAALTHERIVEYNTRVVIPLRTRLIERAKQSSLQLRVWLPQTVIDVLDKQVGTPVRIPRKFIDEAVASEQVREGVRQMMSETLDNFVSKALGSDTSSTSSSGGSGGALRGVLSFGARAAVGVGKGLLGGMGEELQKQLRDRAKDFVDASMSAVQKRLAERLASEETANALGKRRQKAYQKLLATTESESVKWTARAPWAKIDELLPSVITHNLARAELRTVIEQESRAVIESLAAESIGSLLDHTGSRTLAREWAHKHIAPVLETFLQSAHWAEWNASRSTSI
jgi:hypothetical protein